MSNPIPGALSGVGQQATDAARQAAADAREQARQVMAAAGIGGGAGVGVSGEPSLDDYANVVQGIGDWDNLSNEQKVATVQGGGLIAMYVGVAAFSGPAAPIVLAAATGSALARSLFASSRTPWCAGRTGADIATNRQKSALWVHYPGFAGHGAVGDNCVDLAEYPEIQKQNVGPNLPSTCGLPRLPEDAPGFAGLWHHMVAYLWESEFNCGPTYRVGQMDAMLEHTVAIWNSVYAPVDAYGRAATTTYEGNTQYADPGAHGGTAPALRLAFEVFRPAYDRDFQAPRDALVMRHARAVTVHTGPARASLPPAHVISGAALGTRAVPVSAADEARLLEMAAEMERVGRTAEAATLRAQAAQAHALSGAALGTRAVPVSAADEASLLAMAAEMERVGRTAEATTLRAAATTRSTHDLASLGMTITTSQPTAHEAVATPSPPSAGCATSGAREVHAHEGALALVLLFVWGVRRWRTPG